jgi:hypothetical protein
LGSVHGEGVGVVEVLLVDHQAGQCDLSSVSDAYDQCSLVRIDVGDGDLLAGHDPSRRDRGQRDDPVTGRIDPSPRSDKVGSGEMAGLVVAVPAEPIQVSHVLPPPGQQRTALTVSQIGGPLVGHGDEGVSSAGGGVDAVVLGVPGDRVRHGPVA